MLTDRTICWSSHIDSYNSTDISKNNLVCWLCSGLLGYSDFLHLSLQVINCHTTPCLIKLIFLISIFFLFIYLLSLFPLLLLHSLIFLLSLLDFIIKQFARPNTSHKIMAARDKQVVVQTFVLSVLMNGIEMCLQLS